MLALLVSALLLAACGGSDATPTPAPTRVARPTSTPTVAVDASGARIASAGDSVSVHYRGTLDDGSEFDSSLNGTRLTFTVDSGQMIRGFNDAVRGMALGEKVTVRLEANEAYGERRDDLVIDMPIESMPPGTAIGDRLFSANGSSVEVIAVTDATVTLDQNHRLAGQALTFEIELVEIH